MILLYPLILNNNTTIFKMPNYKIIIKVLKINSLILHLYKFFNNL